MASVPPPPRRSSIGAVNTAGSGPSRTSRRCRGSDRSAWRRCGRRSSCDGRRVGGGLRVHGSASLAEARARPLHLGLASLVLGLLAGPGAPLALLAACLLALAVAGRPSV